MYDDLDSFTDYDEFVDRNFRRAHHIAVYLVGMMNSHKGLRGELKRLGREGLE